MDSGEVMAMAERAEAEMEAGLVAEMAEGGWGGRGRWRQWRQVRRW